MKVKNFINNYWLVCLIAVQPVLDVIAFFMQSSSGTIAGYIRLAIMIGLSLYCLIRLPEKKRFIIPMLVIGGFCMLHVLNGFRVGYRNLFSDVKYMMSIIQTPVLAVCFINLIKSDKERDQGFKGIICAAIIYFAFFIIAVVSGTANTTYGTGLGVSGWVIDSNRCANSIILVTYCVFMMCFSVNTDKLLLKITIPVVISAMLLNNGTKSCYITAVGLMAAFAAYTLAECLICRKKLQLVTLVLTVILCITSVVVYPYTPRARQDLLENGDSGRNEDKFRLMMLELGYDIDAMTVDDIIADSELLGYYQTYYYEMIYNGVPHLLDDYEFERVLRSYNAVTKAGVLIDSRLAKRTYAKFIFEDSDFLTKVVGFEFENIGFDAIHLDMENDWHAVYYYYGYLGFTLFAGFTLYFLYLVIKRLIQAFKDSIIPFNYSLVVCYSLQIILAELSGALLRRAHVSVFFALVLALIYYQTVTTPLPAKEDK